jgi:hypothetical protein
MKIKPQTLDSRRPSPFQLSQNIRTSVIYALIKFSVQYNHLKKIIDILKQ